MYATEFIDYLAYFHGPRDFFECHEALEEYWKQDNKEERKRHLVAFIQLAVSLYHYRINNYNGAAKLIPKVIETIQAEKQQVDQLGIDSNNLLAELKLLQQRIKSKSEYADFNIPIADEALLNKCIARAKELGYEWQMPSDLNNLQLLYKHKLRDRSDVILEREKQKQLRKKR